MKAILMLCYGLLASLIPFVIMLVASIKIAKNKGTPITLHRILSICAFGVYIFATFLVTGAGTIFGLLRYGQELHNGQLNLLPFSHDIDTVAYLLNILLFVPFGFLLPLLWPRTGKLRYILLSGLSFSLLIEISQLLSHRATDVDDLIMNTSGALIGYLVYRLFARIAKWDHQRIDYPGYEPYVYIGAMFLGRFLLFNELGLAKILYGF